MRYFSNLFNVLVVFLVVFLAENVLACSPLPMKMRSDYLNSSVMKVLDKAGVRIDQVKSVQEESARYVKMKWVHTDAAFECHDYEEVEVQFVVDLQPAKKAIKSSCTLEATVVRTESKNAEGIKNVEHNILELISNCTKRKVLESN